MECGREELVKESTFAVVSLSCKSYDAADVESLTGVGSETGSIKVSPSASTASSNTLISE